MFLSIVAKSLLFVECFHERRCVYTGVSKHLLESPNSETSIKLAYVQ